MRHTMLVPLQLLVRTGPPSTPDDWSLGDMYYDEELRSVQVWDGTNWGGLVPGGGNEVLIDPDQPDAADPEESSTELWVDTDDTGTTLSGAYLPLAGGMLTGTLIVDPFNPLSTGIIVEEGGVVVNRGGVVLGGNQIMRPDYATSKAYVDSLIQNCCGGLGGAAGGLHSESFGNGVSHEYNIAHNLNTENVVVSVWDESTTTPTMISAEVEIVDQDNLKLIFATPPGINTGRVTVMSGAGQSYGAVLGDGVSETLTVYHGLGTFDVVLSLWDPEQGGADMGGASVRLLDENSLELLFLTPPQPLSVKVVVMSAGPPPQGGGGIGGPWGGGYIHTQNTPMTQWIVAHNLKRHPEVSIEDFDGTVVWATIKHIDDSTLRITFFNPFAGKAYCT